MFHRTITEYGNSLCRRYRSTATILTGATTASKHENSSYRGSDNINTYVGELRGYDQIPGPKAIPFLGNSWRFLPIIGTLTNG